jgi:hypothetical protein
MIASKFLSAIARPFVLLIVDRGRRQGYGTSTVSRATRSGSG